MSTRYSTHFGKSLRWLYQGKLYITIVLGRFCTLLMQSPTQATVSFAYIHGINNHGENSQEIIHTKFSRLHLELLEQFSEEPLTPALLGIHNISEIDRQPRVFYQYQRKPITKTESVLLLR